MAHTVYTSQSQTIFSVGNCGITDKHQTHTFDIIPFYNLDRPVKVVCRGEGEEPER